MKKLGTFGAWLDIVQRWSVSFRVADHPRTIGKAGSQPGIGTCCKDDGTRILLSPEARVADWAEIVLKYPIRDTEALSSCGGVRVAVVDTDVHSRIHNLILRLRKTGEGASLLHGVRVRRGHLKIQLVGTEEKSQHMRNRATSGGVPGGVLGVIGCVDEWLPSRIRDQGRVASTRPDCCYRSPEVIKVLGVPAGDLSIRERGFSQRIHAS